MWSGYSESGQGSEERGPNTFTFNPIALPQQSTEQPGQVNMNLSTVRHLGTQVSNEDRTLDVLASGASKILAPVFDKIAKDKFYEGMQRAAQGEALNDIKENRPWYAKIFGDGATVMGARAYETERIAADYMAEATQAMPDLRKMNADEARQFLTSMADKYRTGDKEADAIIGMNVIKSMPGLLKEHAKARYKYTQEQMSLAQGQALMSGAQQYQNLFSSAHTDGRELTEDDKDGAMMNMVRGWVKPSGQDDEAYNTTMANFIMSQAEAGNFHVIRAVEQSKVLDDLPLDKRRQVLDTIRRYRKADAMAAREEYGAVRYEIQQRIANGEQITGQQVRAAYAEVNAQYSARTGNTEPVFPAAAVGSDAIGAERAQARIDAAIANDAGKGASQEEQVIGVMAGAANGTPMSVFSQAGVHSEQTIQEGYYRQYKATPEEDRREFLEKSSQGLSVIRGVKAEFADRWSASTGYDDAFRLAYADFLSLLPRDGGGNGQLLGKYLSEDQINVMTAFHRNLAGRDFHEFGAVAYDRAKLAMYKQRSHLSKDEDKAIQKAIMKDPSFRDQGFFGIGGDPVGNSSMAVALAMVGDSYGKIRGAFGADQDMTIQTAIGAAKSAGLEMGAGLAWRRDEGMLPLAGAMNAAYPGHAWTEAEAFKGVRRAAESVVRDTYGNVDDFYLVRVTDKNGDTAFVVTGIKDGVELPAAYVSPEIIKQGMLGARDPTNYLDSDRRVLGANPGAVAWNWSEYNKRVMKAAEEQKAQIERAKQQRAKQQQ